jgi:hypothetical protein
MTTSENESLATLAKAITLVITTAIKLAGAYLGLHEGLQTEVRPSVMLLACFMISGGTISEKAVMNGIDKFLGRDK